MRSILLASCVLATLAAGCSREWYRDRADEEVACLIDEKATPEWVVPFQSVEMDPRSRFHDRYDKVYPPMPPDDPASHELMHYVDGKNGWDQWHKNGDINELENPIWKEELRRDVPVDDEGRVHLNLEGAVRLARIHSPTWQSQVETLYLSALDVSTERFRLDTQFIGGAGTGSGGRTFYNNTTARLAGSKAPGGSAFDVGTNTNIQLQRKLATAGELVVGFANAFVWTFSGGDTNFASSALNFSLVQPLLRAGGRQIALETLTISERTLLANMRAFQHFRQGFYTQIAIGENGTTRPSRRGGFTGGSGLSGFSGQGAGGFGGVGDATGFGGSGGGSNAGSGSNVISGSGLAGGGAGLVGGFIGLLQANQQIRNTESSLAAQQQTLRLLEAHLDAGLIDISQVDQFRQSIETERANLLQSRNGLQNQLDGFKSGTLGLPPSLSVVLDESMIEPFQLLDPEIAKLQSDLNTSIDAIGDQETVPSVAELQALLQKQQGFRARIDERLLDVQQEIVRLEEASPVRFQTMTPAEQQSLKRDIQQLRNNRGRLASQFEKTVATLQALEEGLAEESRRQTIGAIITTNVEMANLLSELTLIEARARLETISIDSIELSSVDALEIARANRLDWMNNRAALVDTWRLIEFNGNRLLSNLDVVLNGQMGTVGDNAVKFQARDSTVSAGLRFDTPFNRRVERNDFRQQLIFYQQGRRQMIQFEDGVNRSLRTLLRDLNQLSVNLEIQRRPVAISIRRVDQTRESFNKPTPPQQPGQPVAQFGPTAALNLLTALSDLRSSQNNFMSVWLNYHAGQMRLLRELGIIRIDDDGLWIEESVHDAVNAAMTEASVDMPPDVPEQWYKALDDLPEPAPASVSEDAAANAHGKQNQLPTGTKLNEPASSPGADVASRDQNDDLDTADTSLVERLLGKRFASIFGKKRNDTPDQSDRRTALDRTRSGRTTAARKAGSSPRKLSDSDRHVAVADTRPASADRPASLDQLAESPQRTPAEPEDSEANSGLNMRGRKVRVPIGGGQIRPASFQALSPSTASAPAKQSQTTAPKTLAPIPSDNVRPAVSSDTVNKPLRILRSTGGWRPTAKQG
ncbi:MAG: TolC family protein [Rhodopirellula sp.]|nr:TolC family protein [Rhodopirellula sp.]